MAFTGLRKLVSIKILLLPLYIYTLVKAATKAKPENSTELKILKKLFKWPLTIIILFLSLVSQIFFTILFDITHFILKYKHGDDYMGLIHGRDALFTFESGTVPAVIPMETDDPKEGEKFFEMCYNEIYPSIISKQYKFRCTIEPYYFYYYYKKIHNLDLSKVFQFVDGYNNLEEFKIVLQKEANAPFPYDGKLGWRCIFGRKPIIWDNGKSVIPIVFILSHVLGDGISTTSLMLTNFIINGIKVCKEQSDKMRALIKEKQKELNEKKEKNKNTNDLFGFSKQFWKLMNKEYFVTFDMEKEQTSDLHMKKKLSGEKFYCWGRDLNQSCLKEKIREIRKACGVSHTDVILAAFAGMFREHFINNCNVVPETLKIMMPFYLGDFNFDKIVSVDKNNIPTVNFQNNFTTLQVKLPINKKEIGNNFKEVLKFINQQTSAFKESLDAIVLFDLLELGGGIIPNFIGKFIMKTWFDTTATISNLPGFPPLIYKSGKAMVDTIYFTINFLDSGVTCLLVGQGDDIRSGFTIDKSCVKNYQEAQNMADNIYKYLNIMHKEIC